MSLSQCNCACKVATSATFSLSPLLAHVLSPRTRSAVWFLSCFVVLDRRKMLLLAETRRKRWKVKRLKVKVMICLSVFCRWFGTTGFCHIVFAFVGNVSRVTYNTPQCALVHNHKPAWQTTALPHITTLSSLSSWYFDRCYTDGYRFV